ELRVQRRAYNLRWGKVIGDLYLGERICQPRNRLAAANTARPRENGLPVLCVARNTGHEYQEKADEEASGKAVNKPSPLAFLRRAKKAQRLRRKSLKPL